MIKKSRLVKTIKQGKEQTWLQFLHYRRHHIPVPSKALSYSLISFKIQITIASYLQADKPCAVI